MLKRIAFFFLALIAGYMVMVLLITVAQEVIFGGVSYQTTPLPQLLVAGALTFCSAVAGGAVARKDFWQPLVSARIGDVRIGCVGNDLHDWRRET